MLRLGATAAVPVDLRVIAATHADLASQVERGLFRRDLYYRLAVLRIEMPPCAIAKPTSRSWRPN